MPYHLGMTDTLNFRHDDAGRRYIAERDGTQVAYADVDPIGADALLIKHTEVLQSEEGKGYGSALVRSLLDHARAEKKKVIPICPYAAAFIRKHPEYRDLVR
jgi:uncharacterized protein